MATTYWRLERREEVVVVAVESDEGEDCEAALWRLERSSGSRGCREERRDRDQCRTIERSGNVGMGAIAVL